MARVLTIPARNYEIGLHGPFPVDSFTSADASAVRFTLTTEEWPDVPEAVRVHVRVNDGANVRTTSFTFQGLLLGLGDEQVQPKDAVVAAPRADGSPMPQVSGEAVVEGEASSATLLLEALVPIRTAIVFEAVDKSAA